MVIGVEYICPPISSRNFDWEAWDVNNQNRIGFGRTKQEAIYDLILRISPENPNIDYDEVDFTVEVK